MSRNRVIGREGKIPWHLPEDFRWFKKITTGHILVMGRKTFESIGKPLPNRATLVLSRGDFSHPGVRRIADLAEAGAAAAGRWRDGRCSSAAGRRFTRRGWRAAPIFT